MAADRRQVYPDPPGNLYRIKPGKIKEILYSRKKYCIEIMGENGYDKNRKVNVHKMECIRSKKCTERTESGGK